MSPEQTETLTPQFEIIAPTALESQTRAEIDMQIATARRFPRSLDRVLKRVTELATLDEATAGACFYRLNRQGKNIEGPTIRFAEIAVHAFGNMRYGSRVIANDGKTVTAQGFCHDLENNVMSSQEVKRRITDKEGRTYSEDMQVVTGNAACAIAARNSVFKVIPFAVVKGIMDAAKKVAIGDIKTLSDRRTRMLETLSKLGINEKRACAAVDKNGAAEIGLDELAILFGLYNGVKEGEQTVEEAFPEVKAPAKLGAALPEELPKEKKTRTSRAKQTPEPTPAPTEPKPDENAPARAKPVEGLRNLIRTTGVEEKDVLVYLFSKSMIEQKDTLDTMTDAKIEDVIAAWEVIGKAIKDDQLPGL